MPGSLHYKFPRVPPATALEVLHQCRASLPVLASAGLKVGVDADGNGQILLPAPEDGVARTPLLAAAERALEDAYNATSGQKFSRRGGRDRADGVGVGGALFGLLLEAARSGSAGAAAGAAAAKARENDILAVFDGEQAALPQSLVAFVRRAQGARILVGDRDDLPVIMWPRWDREPGPAVDGLVRAGSHPGVSLLQGFATLDSTVYLPQGLVPSVEHLRYVGHIISDCGDLTWAGNDEAPVAYGVRRLDTGQLEVYVLADQGVVAEAVCPPPAEPIQVSVHLLEGSAEQVTRLRDRITQEAPDYRYRLQFRPLPHDVPRGDDVQRLHDEVRELEERIVLAQGLAGEQLRLLRFPSSGLSGLADAIRRFSMADIDRGVVSYGFQSSRTAPGGAHYLLYTPQDCALQAPFPKARWEAELSEPIAYWVDPGWAAHYQRAGTRSLVFVPLDRSLSPSLHSFGDDDMDEYLAALMSAWAESRENQALPAHPLYLFSPASIPDKDISIEVLDRRGFTPLKQRLGWINKSLQIVDCFENEAFIELVSDLDRHAAAATSLQAAVDADEARLKARAEDLERSWTEQLDGMQSRLAEEIESAIRRVNRAADCLDEMSDRAARLEQSVAEGSARAREVRRLEEEIPKRLDALDETREEVAQRVRAVVARLEGFITLTDKRADNTRQSLDDLRVKLDGLRRR